MDDDGAGPAGPGMPLADWRRTSQEQRIDAVPAYLRERQAATAERIAVTYAFAAQVRTRMAAHSGPQADHHRSRAAWNQLVADFERRQADALRSGRLLAPSPRRHGPPAAPHRPGSLTGRTSRRPRQEPGRPAGCRD